MKILVLGSKGMLGHVLLNRLKKDYKEVTGYAREDFNIVKDSDKLFSNLKKKKFDIVINCIGFLRPKPGDEKEAMFINGEFPHQLAEIVNSYSGKVIHISTDCVFDGKEGNYGTKHPYTANDLYGKSKSIGELKDDKNLTIRTSMIGREIEGRSRNLVEWFLQQKECQGYKNHIWNGLTTNELSNVIISMIKLNKTGIITVVSPKAMSKYELLLLLRKKYKKDTKIIPVDAPEAVNRSLISDFNVKPIEKQIEEMD